jgi:hypothetical protein
VFREDDVDVPREAQVRTDKDPHPNHDGKPEPFGLEVADIEGEVAALDAPVEGHDTKEILTLLRDGVFLGGDRDLPREPQPSFVPRQENTTKDRIWQARVTKGWRFYFKILGDTYDHRLEEIRRYSKGLIGALR